MLSLTIGSSVIPINPSISFPLVLRNPIFPTSEGKIPGSYIYNTSLPATEQLRREFSQAHRLTRHGRATAELDYVLQNGIFKYQGKCTVVEANPMSYEVAFKVDNGDFASQISSKSLKDLDLGGDRAVTGVCSFASLTSPVTYDQTDTEYFELNVNAPNQIISNFFDRMSDSGKMFTAESSFNCVMKLVIAGTFTTGALHVIVTKNGSTILDEVINSSSLDSSYNVPLSLVNSDEIIVSSVIETEAVEGGYACEIILEEFIVEFSAESIFTQTALLDQSSSDFAIFPVQNEKLLNNFPDDAFELDNLSIKTIYSQYQKIQNHYMNDEFTLFPNGIVEEETIACANLFTPMVYLHKLLQEIIEEAGYRLLNSPFDDDNFFNAVMFNNYAENTYSSEETRVLPIKLTFNLTDHVPDIKQSDFINYVVWLTGFIPVVNNNNLTVDFIDIRYRHIESINNASEIFPGTIIGDPEIHVAPEYKGIKYTMKAAGSDQYLNDRIKSLSTKMTYKGEVAGLTSLPSSGNEVNDYYKVTNDNSFYVWQYNPDIYALGWWFFSKDFPLEYTEGEEPYLQISTGFSPVLTSLMKDENLGAPADRYWNIPVTWQPGILEGFPESLSAEYGIQVLRYMGLQADSLGDNYPMGSSWMKNYDGDTLTGIDLNAESIFNNRFKEFLQWLAYDAKPVKLRALLTPAQLKGLNITKIQRYHNYSFLIKELKVNLLYDHLSIAELDVYVC